MKTVKVRFKVEDDGFFYQEVEYTDSPENAIDTFILLWNNAYGKGTGVYIENYEIVK